MLEWLRARFGRKRQPLVTVLRLSGVIGQVGGLMPAGITLAGMAGSIEQAFKPKGLTAVALVVNSPGGSPVQSALVAKRIRDLAAEKQVPVLAFVEDVAASGGYWLACAGDEIIADAGSVIGSIGVISAGFGFPELIRRHGIERRVHAVGRHKGMLDSFQPEDPEDVARLKELQTDIFEHFAAYVRERRAGRLKAPEAELFTGAFWTGRRALGLGLVDRLGDLRAVLRERYGDKVRLVPVRENRSLLARLRRGGGGGGISHDVAAALLSVVEERALWSRFGL